MALFVSVFVRWTLTVVCVPLIICLSIRKSKHCTYFLNFKCFINQSIIIIDHVAQPKGEYCIYENIEFRNIRLLYYNRQYKKSLSSMTGPPKTKRGGKRRGKSEFDSVISFLT